MPQRMAIGAGRPRSAANLVITMLPSAMIMPQDRSMPAVRMISVWPIAIMPTTITCCRISEKFSPREEPVGAWKPKMAQAMSSAMAGPSVPIGGSLLFSVFTDGSLSHEMSKADAAQVMPRKPRADGAFERSRATAGCPPVRAQRKARGGA